MVLGQLPDGQLPTVLIPVTMVTISPGYTKTVSFQEFVSWSVSYFSGNFPENNSKLQLISKRALNEITR